MSHKFVLIGLISIIALIAIYLHEGFQTKREKAGAIYNWFASNPNPLYSNYRAAIGSTNVVEFEDVRNLFRNKNLTVTDIENAI